MISDVQAMLGQFYYFGPEMRQNIMVEGHLGGGALSSHGIKETEREGKSS